MAQRTWKTAQRRERSKIFANNATKMHGHSQLSIGTELNSIKEMSSDIRSTTSSKGSGRSGHSEAGRINGSGSSANHSSSKSVTSQSIDNVFQMLEEERVEYTPKTGTASSTNANKTVPVQTQRSDADELEKEIEKEHEAHNDVDAVDISPSPPPRQAFNHQQSHNYTHAQSQAQDMAHDDQYHRQRSDDENEEDGPVIYANHDDDDDFSQITSSIAGNTLYSHEYMFSSISFPKNKLNNQAAIPSLDGTDSGGSGGSSGSGVSQLPPMDENKTLAMDNGDFERFFGTGSSSGASQRKTLNHASRSRDEADVQINNTYLNGNGSSIRPHVHSLNHISSHRTAIDDTNDDTITIGDIYSYAPSTVGGDVSTSNLNTSNPLIWIYNQGYNLFNAGRKSRRKKDDDFGESLDGDTDYFATLMSADFPTSSPNNYPWKKGHRRRKLLNICSIFSGLIFFGLLMYSGDVGTESDLSMTTLTGTRGGASTVIKTTTKKDAEDSETVVADRTPSMQVDRSHEGTPLPSIFENFAEVMEASDGSTPFFWHIPRSGGATMNDIFSICHHLRVATNIGIVGGHHLDTNLDLMDYEGQKYLNVDISTAQGIQRAVDMGFASSDLTDVAISSLLHDSAPLFTPLRKGKMFTIFRHPVDRMVSMFYFMQDTVWKAPSTYNKELAEITIESYFLRQLGENNWHVRFLTNQLTKAYVDEQDFQLAKEILRRKTLVGLLSQKDESFDRFAKHFGWKPKKGRDLECQKRRLQWDWSLRHPHEVEILEGNRLWNLISGQNEYDMRLYEYAQYLFEEQSKMFK